MGKTGDTLTVLTGSALFHTTEGDGIRKSICPGQSCLLVLNPTLSFCRDQENQLFALCVVTFYYCVMAVNEVYVRYFTYTYIHIKIHRCNMLF